MRLFERETDVAAKAACRAANPMASADRLRSSAIPNSAMVAMAGSQALSIQRDAAHSQGAGPLAPSIAADIRDSLGGGQSLPTETKAEMEGFFGTDLGAVRIHTDSEADRLSRSVQAKAFTTGNDVFFRQAEFNTTSDSGRRLLAHELTHVTQQGSPSVAAKAGLVSDPSDSLERDADRSADAFVSAPRQDAPITPAQVAQVQRSGGNSAATQFVQRACCGQCEDEADGGTWSFQDMAISREADDTDPNGADPDSAFAGAARYNASRGYAGEALRVVQAAIRAPEVAPHETEFAAKVATWQGDSLRLQSLTPDGMLGPSSLGTLAAELNATGRDGLAEQLDGYSQKAPSGLVEGSEGGGSSCEGTAAHGPGTSKVLENLPTVKRFEIGNFDIAKWFVKDEHRDFLRSKFVDAKLLDLLATGDWGLFINGHASTTGGDGFNRTLSTLRALCVHETLLDLGLSAGVTATDGAGEFEARKRLEDAGAPRTDDVESSKDRRVEIMVVRGKKPRPPSPPPTEDPTCPTQEQLCAMWPEIVHNCGLHEGAFSFLEDAACFGIVRTQHCLLIWMGQAVDPTIRPLAEKCCLPASGPAGEELRERIFDCAVDMMGANLHLPEEFPDCEMLDDSEALRRSLDDCMAS